LQLNYRNHTQAVEHGVKLSGIAGKKQQIGEALCTLVARNAVA